MKETASAPRALGAVDYATLAYHGAVLLLAGTASLLHGLPLHAFAFNILAMASVLGLHFITRRVDHPVLFVLRQFYPLLFFLPIYEQIGSLNHVFLKENLDEVLL